ncbi:MAG: MAPEG family protein [Deltaproteobacteria bacterium]|nr:MAPEG family protein [Deltaproteobacteria bacterium]
MTIPIWALLGFATWTVLLLSFTIGVYRWRRILSGRGAIADFKADQVEGEDWYRRSMRAHANCIENLPVFGAIVLALQASGTSGATVDALSIAIPLARVVQSSVHVGFVETNRSVGVRFSFFCVQLVSFLALIVLIVQHAA